MEEGKRGGIFGGGTGCYQEVEVFRRRSCGDKGSNETAADGEAEAAMGRLLVSLFGSRGGQIPIGACHKKTGTVWVLIASRRGLCAHFTDKAMKNLVV